MKSVLIRFSKCRCFAFFISSGFCTERALLGGTAKQRNREVIFTAPHRPPQQLPFLWAVLDLGQDTFCFLVSSARHNEIPLLPAACLTTTLRRFLHQFWQNHLSFLKAQTVCVCLWRGGRGRSAPFFPTILAA